MFAVDAGGNDDGEGSCGCVGEGNGAASGTASTISLSAEAEAPVFFARFALGWVSGLGSSCARSRLAALSSRFIRAEIFFRNDFSALEVVDFSTAGADLLVGSSSLGRAGAEAEDDGAGASSCASAWSCNSIRRSTKN